MIRNVINSLVRPVVSDPTRTLAGISPSLKYDFVNNPSLTGHLGPDLSFTRATSATMTDADGWIREVQSGEARFDGATFNHNLVTYSESEFDTQWTKSNVTVTDDADSVTHDGQTIQLSELADDATNAEHSVGLLNFLGYSISSIDLRHIVSAYVKAGTSGYIGFAANNDESSADIFDASTGTWVDTDTYESHDVEDVGAGVYRVSFVIPTNISFSAGANDLLIIMSDDGSNKTYSGSGDTVVVGGVMMQADPTDSMTGPTTYIKTTGSIVTDLSTGTSNGILIEEARTNIALHSEDFTDAAWVKNNATVTADDTTAPDGATTADKLGDDSSTGTGQVHVEQTVTVSTETTYTLSCFMEADQLSWGWLGVKGLTTPADSEAWFDLSNGVVGTVDGGFDDSGIEDYGNGRYRCWVSFTTDATDTSGEIEIGVADSDASLTVDLDGTSSIHIWGTQCEAGAFPTSYISTEGATVTRNADQPTTTTLTWFNANEGTWYIKGQFPYADSVANALLTLDDGGTSDRFYFERDAAENINFATTHNSDTDGASNGSAVIAVDTNFEVAAAFADDDVIAYVDGTSSGADSSAAIPLGDTMTTLRIGHDSGGNYWNGLVADARHYRQRLPNATLENLSNGIDP